jgi:DnaD/phage-associated family protein
MNKIKKSITKKLGFMRNLSEYEEAYVTKWVSDYNYPLEIIEMALKKTTSKTNPSFDYIDKILTDWHERKLNKRYKRRCRCRLFRWKKFFASRFFR